MVQLVALCHGEGGIVFQHTRCRSLIQHSSRRYQLRSIRPAVLPCRAGRLPSCYLQCCATRREKLTEQGRPLTGDSVRSRPSRCSPGRKSDLRSGIPGWSPMRACGTAWSRRLSSGVCGHRTGGGWPPHRTIGPSGSGTPNPVLRASSSSTPGGRKPGVVTGQPADRLRFARWGQPDLGCRIENRMQNRESYGRRPPPPLPTIERR